MQLLPSSEGSRPPWVPSLAWNAIEVATAPLQALPEPDLQSVMARFRADEAFCAPLRLLRAWLRGAAQANTLDLSSQRFAGDAAHSGQSRNALVRLLNEAAGTRFARLMMPGNLELLSKRAQVFAALLQQAGARPLEAVREVCLPSITSACRGGALRCLLRLLPNAQDISLSATCAPFEQHSLAALNKDIEAVFCDLAAARVRRVCIRIVEALPTPLYELLGSGLAACSSLTALEFSPDPHAIYMAGHLPRVLAALPDLQRLHVWSLSAPAESSSLCVGVAEALAALSHLVALTELSVRVDGRACCDDATTCNLLEGLADALEPLQSLRLLDFDCALPAPHFSLCRPGQVSHEQLAGFDSLLSRISHFKPGPAMQLALLPAVPSLVHVESLTAYEATAATVLQWLDVLGDFNGIEGADSLSPVARTVSALGALTALTCLYIDVENGEYGMHLYMEGANMALACMPGLRFFELRLSGSRKSGIECSVLPALAKLTSLEVLHLHRDAPDYRGWPALRGAPLVSTLTELMLTSEYSGCGGGVDIALVPVLVEVLGCLTSLKFCV